VVGCTFSEVVVVVGWTFSDVVEVVGCTYSEVVEVVEVVGWTFSEVVVVEWTFSDVVDVVGRTSLVVLEVVVVLDSVDLLEVVVVVQLMLQRLASRVGERLQYSGDGRESLDQPQWPAERDTHVSPHSGTLGVKPTGKADSLGQMWGMTYSVQDDPSEVDEVELVG
jgi:hypothetical protein